MLLGTGVQANDVLPALLGAVLDPHGDELAPREAVRAVHLKEVFLIWQEPALDVIACHHLVTWFDVSGQFSIFNFTWRH